MRVLIAALLAAATVAAGQDYEAAALEILTGKPLSDENRFVDPGDRGRTGTTAGIGMKEIRAITNRADVVALARKTVDDSKSATARARLADPAVAELIAEIERLKAALRKLEADALKDAAAKAAFTATDAAAWEARLKAADKTAGEKPK